MLSETRKMLDEIDEVLSRGDDASRELALVLSALRGPDDGDELKKDLTTAIIRTAALPRMANEYIVRAQHGWIFRSGKRIELSRKDYNSHFGTHVRAAALVLGLEVVTNA